MASERSARSPRLVRVLKLPTGGLGVLSAVIAAAAVLHGCGGGSADGIDHEPALSERDVRGDVLDVRRWREERADRPEVDLLGAGIDTAGRRLRLHVMTDAPPRGAVVTFAGRLGTRCVDAQLAVVIRIPPTGEPAVTATDLADDHPQRVAGARVAVDDTHINAILPLRRHADFVSWTVFSYDAHHDSQDSVPDWVGAAFTRGTGRRNIVGRYCGPATPPLLNR